MESNCKAEDDLDAGWLEVKKKHRGSSKFSIQGLVGGFSNKGRSNFLRNRSSVNDRSGKSNAKQRSQHSKVRQDFSTHVMMGGENSNSLSKEADKVAGQEFATHVLVDGEKSNCVLKQAEKAIHCLDKCVVNLDTELPKSPPARSTNFKESNDVTEKVKIVTQNEKLDIVPKIKWGDLEDDALVICRENLDKAEIKFGNLGDDNLVYKKLGNSNDLVSCDPSCADPQEDKAVVTPADADLVGTVSSTMRNESFEENCREFNEISIVDEKMVTPNDYNHEEIHHKHVEPMNVDVKDVLDFNYPETENGLSTALDNKSEDGAVYISEVPVENEVTSIVVDGQHSVLPPVLTSDPEASGDASVGVVVEEQKGSQEDTVNMAFSKVQFMNAFEEGESSESKERFRQRLWCFLFENLNRAIDELYLLCELECDLDQMKEAVLVLEEAGFDFKELKSRVEGFENAKRSSAQPSVDGLLGNVKIDHRRPHALSWEVRRMTASPHRAEILSSSLEAFKKIQNERTSIRSVHDAKTLDPACANHVSNDFVGKSARRNDRTTNARESLIKSRKQSGLGQGNLNGEKRNMDGGRSSKSYSVQLMSSSTPDPNPSQVPLRDSTAPSLVAKSKREPHGSASESEKHLLKKEKILTESKAEKNPKYMDPLKRQIPLPDKEKEKRNTTSCKSMDAWKEKRNWEDILTSPLRISSRFSHSPGMSRRSVERARVLHDKLMSPEKKKKTTLDLKKEAAEKHARAMRIRSELENERVQRLQRTSEKLNRVNEWQAVRTMKLREGMNARQQRSESRHEAYLAQVARRAGDESSKVNEVRFITSLNEENKKFMLRQKLHDSELRRAGKLQIIKTKQKEDLAREEAVLERRRLLQAEKLQRLAETQKKKEEAQVRREEDRKASSAAREARAIEQLRRKEVRAKAQQEEAELLAQKLAERLSESEQRRKFYLEQIRERAAMDFRDQSSPLLRRSSNKEGLGKSTSTSNVEDYQANSILGVGGSALGIGDTAQQPSLKRRIKKIRQRLMALKYEFPEVPISAESSGIGYRTLMGTARGKIGRWLQELQRLRQARKEGAASIGLIVSDMIKFFEGRETELHASRQAGLLDFIASALPASHTSRPEACQVTIYLLRLLRVVLSVPANRSYFLAQNLLPPIIPMLSAALENYIKIAASLNVPGNSNSLLSKTSIENFESVSEVLEGFLWTVTTIIGHICPDERQLQMLDGLLELVIAYQVIHRLRDLFALYDRPQVEGSPFPSSIILSLNLLAVLTSRPKTISSIDWGYFPSKTVSANESEETKLAESTELHDSSSNITDRDQNVVTDRPLSDVPEEKPLNESCLLIKHEEPLSNARDPEKDLTDISVDLNHISGAPHKCLVEWQSKPSLAQKDVKSSTDIGSGRKKENIQDLKQPVTFLLSVIAETGLVSLPSLLTAVLLQANSRLSSEQASYVLPSNFEEVATGVLKVLNNLALLDITLMQKMLARPDLKMEFFHLMSFLLSHCTSKWKLAGDQVGLLLLESLLLLGYFALFHPGNQAVLRWGKSPTILHKVCDLPFVFFSDPELMPILAGTLVASCYGCEQNRGVVQQELSTDMLLSLLGSCRNGLLSVQSNPSLLDNPTMTTDSCEGNQAGTEPKMFQVDFPVRSRHYQRNTRVSLGKSGGTLGNSVRVSKSRNQKDGKATKTCEDWALKHNLPASETSSTFMLHSRFPSSFIDRAEEFFSAGITSVSDKV